MATIETVRGVLVSGHGIASGQGARCPYPGGSLVHQLPRFRDLGLELSHCWPGTLNVSTAPKVVRVAQPTHRFENVDWGPWHPPETFTFLRCALVARGERFEAWVYRPSPETKARDFQADEIVEVMAPWIEGVGIGDPVELVFGEGDVQVEG